MNNRGMKASADCFGCEVDGCLNPVLRNDSAKAKAPPLNASCLSANAQKNLLPGFVTTAGMSITMTKISNVIATRAAASRAWTITAILTAAQIKARPTR